MKTNFYTNEDRPCREAYVTRANSKQRSRILDKELALSLVPKCQLCHLPLQNLLWGHPGHPSLAVAPLPEKAIKGPPLALKHYSFK